MKCECGREFPFDYPNGICPYCEASLLMRDGDKRSYHEIVSAIFAERKPKKKGNGENMSIFNAEYDEISLQRPEAFIRYPIETIRAYLAGFFLEGLHKTETTSTKYNKFHISVRRISEAFPVVFYISRGYEPQGRWEWTCNNLVTFIASAQQMRYGKTLTVNIRVHPVKPYPHIRHKLILSESPSLKGDILLMEGVNGRRVTMAIRDKTSDMFFMKERIQALLERMS